MLQGDYVLDHAMVVQGEVALVNFALWEIDFVFKFGV